MLAGLDKAKVAQAIGGFLGGPIRKNRAFFFSSVEQTRIDNDLVITSPDLQTFRPGESPNFANPVRGAAGSRTRRCDAGSTRNS